MLQVFYILDRGQLELRSSRHHRHCFTKFQSSLLDGRLEHGLFLESWGALFIPLKWIVLVIRSRIIIANICVRHSLFNILLLNLIKQAKIILPFTHLRSSFLLLFLGCILLLLFDLLI